MSTLFSDWPAYAEDEQEAAAAVLASGKVNYWTGSQGKAFETEFAEWSGAAFALTVGNGTLALQLALHALEIGPGDDVLVTARSFMASASSIVLAGARPVFVDIDRDSQNVTAETLAAALTPATKAIVCVHLAGWPCDMEPILALAEEHGLRVIEDCAQAHGARYKGRSVGTLGDIGAWSFCQDKIMTTAGEGGMVTISDPVLYERMWSFRDHGKSRRKISQPASGTGFRWVHDNVGSNYRMTEIQSAVGRCQLRKMKDWHQRRLHNARRIWNAAAASPLYRVPEVPQDCEHGAYKCYVFIEPAQLAEGWTRNRVVSAINELGVPCFHGSCPEMYLEDAFNNDNALIPEPRLPVARELGETSLMFLVHPTLSDQAIDAACRALGSVSAQACAGAVSQSEVVD
ncbi:DegT/DnrJ/EryC1/StrS aminotransferase family protein [Granulosicoccaceae sp. 1_MG-2023]|nr:DegT/DnrJ/EryC1/StrS aminotransferase family protein [Granulosicoccaceae sp. 1_MG-2023]